MDLNQIAVFIRVVDAGSMTKAARILKQPKSRVSRRIAALEKVLGVSLLYRSTRQFSVTEAGRVLYDRCRQQVYELETAAESLQDSAQEIAGVLHVTAAEDVGSTLLSPVIAEAGDLYPKLSVHLHLSNEFVDLVRTGVDLAVRIGDLADTSLKARLIGRIVFILVASPGYLKKAPNVERIADLTQHPALFFDTGDDDDQWHLRTKNRRAESISPDIRYRVNHPQVLLELALAGRGIALIPEFLCQAGLRDGHLKRILPLYETDPSPVHFVWPTQRDLNPKVRAFVELGVKRLGARLALARK